MDPAGEGVRYRRLCLNHGLFTLRVNKDVLCLRFHLGRFRRFGCEWQLRNCRI
jgi:hypothetical protein